jgi:tetratricopeptide (TPR) repeat protein
MRVRPSLNFDAALDLLRGNRDPNLQHFIFQEARRELTSNDEASLRALSFFAPSATFEAWAEVAQLSRTELEAAIDRLSVLSLVNLPAGEERYALHPLTRNFVRDELLVDKQLARAAGTSFVGYWVAYAKRYGGASENYKTFNLIESEWMNLDAAAEWLWQVAGMQGKGSDNKEAAQALNNLALALCDTTGPLFFTERWDEGLKLSERAYELTSALGDWKDAGWHAFQMAWIYFHQDDTAQAEQWTTNCAKAWSPDKNRHYLAIEMSMRGLIARQRTDYDTAERLLQDALSIWRNLKSDRDAASELNSLGVLEVARKNYDMAVRYYLEALALDKKLDWKEGIAVRYGNLGKLSLIRERWAEAREWFEKLLPLAHEVGRQGMIIDALTGLARVYEEEGRVDLALALAQEAFALELKLRPKSPPETKELVETLKKRLDAPEPTL